MAPSRDREETESQIHAPGIAVGLLVGALLVLGGLVGLVMKTEIGSFAHRTDCVSRIGDSLSSSGFPSSS
jgi:hypothetical protein